MAWQAAIPIIMSIAQMMMQGSKDQQNKIGGALAGAEGEGGKFNLNLTQDKYNKELQKLDDPTMKGALNLDEQQLMTMNQQYAPSQNTEQANLGIVGMDTDPGQQQFGLNLQAAVTPEDIANAQVGEEAMADMPQEGEKFNADQAMQWAAMAAQLGAAFSPEKVRPPSLRGGGSFNLRSVYGGR